MASRWSFVLAAFLWACGAMSQERATGWPEADALFRTDPLWLGSDAAFSVDLGRGRVLWLFGDTFLARRAGETRREAAFVRNSVGIETGYDPAKATIRFYGGRGADGGAASFFPEDGGEWFWPMQGVRLGPRLLLFAMRETRYTEPGSLGFRAVGWNAFLIENPDEEPARWRMRRVEGPEPRGQLMVGMAVVREAGFVYAFAEEDRTHDAYLLRWSERAARAGALKRPQWWCGETRRWCGNAGLRRRVMEDAGSEFSVQRDRRGGWLEVASRGFGATTLGMRRAERLEGPWSKEEEVFTPPESRAAGAFVYAGKGHPELEGADVVATYAANGTDERVATDMSLYFPRFVRIELPKR